MYLIDGMHAEKIPDRTFADCQMLESNVEELLRQNIELVCDEEESMLLVGQQVTYQTQARCDLIAIDHNGNLVLIELKRDKKDIELRHEALEFQAIRYAAGIATIQTSDELIQKVFAPYIEKHRNEFGQEHLSSNEVAKRLLDTFIEANQITQFNERQRIILVASDFDDQTLSAVAWLNSNKVDISCYRMIPSQIDQHLIVNLTKILPLPDYADYYIGLKEKRPISKTSSQTATRQNLPKINTLLEWRVVKAGDIIVAKGKSEETILNEDGTVSTNHISLQQWLKSVFGWSSVATYDQAVHKDTGKTLSELRQTYMENLAEQQENLDSPTPIAN